MKTQINTLSLEEREELFRPIKADIDMAINNKPRLSEINEPPDMPIDKAFINEVIELAFKQLTDAVQKLESENETLKQDNRDLVEQMNAQSEQVKLLDTALEIACDVYDSEMGIAKCPALVTGGECVNGGSGCDHLDTPSASDCWKQAFIKAAEKHLGGEK